MAEWFKSWFDTEYYHILYKNRDEEEAQLFVSKLMKGLALKESSLVLDLCCGKGRHAKHLNDLGYKVVGVDLSESSIEFAKQFENPDLSFKVHDMRKPLKDLQFDAVLNLFTSFGYFDRESDNLEVLESIKSYLKPKGILLIDFVNVILVNKCLPVKEDKIVDSIKFSMDKKLDNGFITKTIVFEDKGRSHTYVEKVQSLELEDFKIMLDKSGFDLLDVYGDYSLSTFDPQKSCRLIIKARLK